MKAIAFLPSSSAVRAATPAAIAQKAVRTQERPIFPFFTMNAGVSALAASAKPTERHSVFECFWFK